MVDIFFKCTSCGKHLVVDDSAAGANVNCPDCNDIVVIPTLVVPRLCPHCSQELKFAGNMTWEHVQCSACKADVVLLSALPRNHEADSSATRPTLLAREGDGSAIKRNIDGVESCPKCGHPMGDRILVCVECGYEALTGKNAFEEAKHLAERVKHEPDRTHNYKPPMNKADRENLTALVVVVGLCVLVAGLIFGAFKLSENNIREQDQEEAVRNDHRREEGQVDDATAKAAVQVYLKHTLKDPGSYESVKWSEVVKVKNLYVIQHTYRARNSFGAYDVETRFFTLDSGGSVISVGDSLESE